MLKTIKLMSKIKEKPETDTYTMFKDGRVNSLER